MVKFKTLDSSKSGNSRKSTITVPSLSSNEEIQLAVYGLECPSEGKVTYSLGLETFKNTSLYEGLTELVLNRLGLPSDHAIIDAVFQDGVQSAIYQPCLVRGTAGLCLKVVNTLIPITLGENSFLLNELPVKFRVGMSGGQKPYPYLTMVVKVTANNQPYEFEFGSLFDKNTVPLMPIDQVKATLMGFQAEYDHDLNKVVMPSPEDFEAATELLMGWGLSSGGGTITRMGQLNQQLFDLGIDPTVTPLVFWPTGGKLQPPQEGKDYPPSFRFWGRWAESTLQAVPELEHVTHLSMNEPQFKSPNRIHWMLMTVAANEGLLEGTALKIVGVSEPTNHCSKLGFYTKPKVAKCKYEFETGQADSLGFGVDRNTVPSHAIAQAKETEEDLAMEELPAKFKELSTEELFLVNQKLEEAKTQKLTELSVDELPY